MYPYQIESLNKARLDWKSGIRNINFHNWNWECGDGCCSDYGTNVSVNGFEFKYDGSDTEAILFELLEFLEIDGVNMTDSDNYEEMSRMRELRDEMDNWDDFDE